MTDFVAKPEYDFQQFLEKAPFPCAVLHLHVKPGNQHLLSVYKQHIYGHNKKIVSDPFPDSGFDLFFPNDTVFPANQQHEAKFTYLEVKGKMDYYTEKNVCKPCAYTLEPRSSISKTPLMLANGRGIIDSGYRGWFIAAFRSLIQGEYFVYKLTRLVQVLHPTLCPILVRLVIDEQELSAETTSRGDGGFGSTGNIGTDSS